MKALAMVLTALQLPFLMGWAFLRRARRYTGGFPKTHTWYRAPLSGGTSSDGSAYSAYFKKGRANKTVVYFSGGGASWNEYTAARPTTLWRALCGRETYYYPYVRFYLELGMDGLLAANDARNPFNDWNYIYLPYSTGDFHIGSHDFAYTKKGRQKLLRHRGGANVRLALQAAPQAFLGAEQVLICGESAGAFAALANAPGLAAFFPHAKRLAVYADGAQMCAPVWRQTMQQVWKTAPEYYEGLQPDGQLVRDWFLRLHQAFKGEVTCLHSVSAYDGVLASFESKLNDGDYIAGKKQLERFHENLAAAVGQLSAAMPEYRYYIYAHGRHPHTGATAHTIVRTPVHFYSEPGDGLSVCEWLSSAAQGAAVPNIGRQHFSSGGFAQKYE